MKHESNEKLKIEVIDTELNFESIYSKPYIPVEYLNEIRSADILLIPYEKFRDSEICLFPEETSKLFTYLVEKSKDHNYTIEICVSDENYNELELHSDVINIADILVNQYTLGILINLISSYLYDKLRKYNRKDSEVNTKINITVEMTKKSKMISYEGSIENFERAMLKIEEQFRKE